MKNTSTDKTEPANSSKPGRPQSEIPEIKNLLAHEIEDAFDEMGLERYRAGQVIGWVHDKGVTDWGDMTNLSKSLREALKERFRLQVLVPASIKISKDGTRKYIFELPGSELIESVLIPDGKRRTLCISSQVGCPFNCAFCYTGTMGFTRNLEMWEILEQFLAVRRERPEDLGPTNVVFMGMGEPLLNYDNVARAVRMMHLEQGINLSRRRITISTAGIPEAIERLAGDDLPMSLALSLNAPDDETRSKIMPINKKYPLAHVLDAIDRFPLNNSNRITFEYVMIKGINDSPLQARQLANLVKRFPCKINLISFNPFPGCRFEPSPRKTLEEFQSILIDRHFSVFIRKSRGADIMAACGQLVGER